MIRLVTGVPGSGKTYFAVHEIVSRFFRWDTNLFLFVQKNTKKPVTIITNVDSLKLPHLNLDNLLEEVEKERFFTVEYQKKLLKEHKHIVYLIDECQRYFDKKFYNKDVFFLFQYHRHLGLDFYLITQSIKTVAMPIIELLEYEIRAVRRTNRFKSVFTYHFVANGEKIGTKYIKADNKVFNIYKSFQAEEVIKKDPEPLKKYFMMFIVMILVVIVGFSVFMKNFFKVPVKKEVKLSVKQQGDVQIKDNIKTDINKKNIISALKNKSDVSELKINGNKTIKLASANKFNLKKSVWVKMGSLSDTGTMTLSKSGEVFFLIFGKIYKKSDVPYPVMKDNNGEYYLLLPTEDLPTALADSSPSVSSSSDSLLLSSSNSSYPVYKENMTLEQKRLFKSYLAGDPYYRLGQHY